MDPAESVGTQLRYGRDLINCGLRGLREGSHSYLRGKPICSALLQSALDSAGLAAIGACAGLVPLSLKAVPNRARKSFVFGVLGCTLGFSAAFMWKTRRLASSMASGAKKEIESASDQHWLERHPIDYA